MKNWIKVCFVVLSLAAAGPARAAAPALIPLQGVLTDASSVPINTTVSVVFALYDVETSGTALWTETQNVSVQNGLFVAYLGQVQALALSLFRDHGTLWLGVTVGVDSEMARVKLGSAPYAGYAEYCGNVPAYTAGDGLLLATNAFSANFTTTGGENGTAVTVARGDHTHNAAYLNVDTQETTSAAVMSGCTSNTNGPEGVSGVFQVSNTDATTAGVCIVGNSRRKIALKGVANVDGWTKYGVVGSATGTGSNYGVYGVASGAATTNYAGYFDGNLHTTGTLSKAAGTFVIDHPLDPRNKVLRHSFVESPDMMNVYNGVVTLDANGEAVISLPDYFEALNRDFRYQLTTVGGYARVYVKSEVRGNRFVVASADKAKDTGVKVSWQVTGVRQDAYAKAHPIVVEEAKGGTSVFPANVCLSPESCR
jgi:hypothetical protein